MNRMTCTTVAAAAAVVLACLVVGVAEGRHVVVRRDADEHHDPHNKKPIDPHKLKEMTDWSILRDKRKVEAVSGVKNAVLGFVFNKINSFIDQKTAWVDQLDHTNIEKNKAAHIFPPKDPVVSLSHVITDAIGSKLQSVGPLLNLVTSKFGSFSHGGHDDHHGSGHKGFDLVGGLISKGFSASGHGSSGGGHGHNGGHEDNHYDPTAHGHAI
ncbi:unnamed protein product [Acanthoscelides obtectus]|uniref:Uncharacterized protein n=1 Tax=Acanthoscelides obtectus TaxID=200917 RepID=A0A9P0M319_ACAOB|nr:unnamed protein product [Acanthoscelides obtectus]CAK1646261.1 hypothetical protein AOBTE_LOCUS14538 [Acanthoscelides obtectus]